MRMAEAALAAALPFAAPVAAQEAPAEQPLAWLTGSWRGTGTMMGNPSEATLTVTPTLDGRFLQFDYRAGRIEGRAFYRLISGGHWQATWFDNRGITFPINAHAIEQSLRSEWGSPETEQGRTVYFIGVDGSLRVTDSVRRPDGSYAEFASHIMEPVR